MSHDGDRADGNRSGSIGRLAVLIAIGLPGFTNRRSTESGMSASFLQDYGMHLSNFRRLQQRVSRARDTVAKKDAVGFTQILNTTADEKLVVIGIKSPEQLEDELLQLFVWIWSMKDYLKHLAVANGAQGQQIEDIVNTEDSLAIAADIANRDKHGKLTKSRTGDFAKLTNLGYEINQSAVNSIEFGKSELRVDVGKPNDAQLYASIEFESGSRPALDAFQTIEDAMRIWETKAYPIAGV